MNKHTAGPWQLIGKQGTAVWCGDKIIAQMADPRSNHKQARSNALLIAAAPDLLDALRDIVSWIPNADAMARLGFLTDAPELSRQKAVAAIAKAIGESHE